MYLFSGWQWKVIALENLLALKRLHDRGLKVNGAINMSEDKNNVFI